MRATLQLDHLVCRFRISPEQIFNFLKAIDIYGNVPKR